MSVNNALHLVYTVNRFLYFFVGKPPLHPNCLYIGDKEELKSQLFCWSWADPLYLVYKIWCTEMPCYVFTIAQPYEGVFPLSIWCDLLQPFCLILLWSVFSHTRIQRKNPTSSAVLFAWIKVFYLFTFWPCVTLLLGCISCLQQKTRSCFFF